jgi:hypothetical protein
MKEFLKRIEFKTEIKACEVFKSIDEIKNDKEKTEKIVKSIENLGFLHEVDDDRKADCAIAMGQFSTFMIFSKDKDSHDEILETLAFPIIARLFKYTDAWPLYSTKKLTEIIYGKNFGKYVDKVLFSAQGDGEAMLCGVFTGELVKKLKNDSYDFDKGLEEHFNNYLNSNKQS